MYAGLIGKCLSASKDILIQCFDQQLRAQLKTSQRRHSHKNRTARQYIVIMHACCTIFKHIFCWSSPCISCTKRVYVNDVWRPLYSFTMTNRFVFTDCRSAGVTTNIDWEAEVLFHYTTLSNHAPFPRRLNTVILWRKECALFVIQAPHRGRYWQPPNNGH